MDNQPEYIEELYPDLIARLIEFAGDPEFPEDEGSSGRFNPETQRRGDINVERLFGESQRPWDFEPTDDELGGIEDAFKHGEPTESESGTTQGNWPLTWEACAWYQPIHFYGADWGIYIKESCVFTAAQRFARFVAKHEQHLFSPREWFNRLSVAALLAYYYHEHYHHRVESLGFRLHVVLGRSCYRLYKANIYRVLQKNLGLYPFGPYTNGWDPDEQIEEALANANSYRNLSLRGLLGAKLPKPVTQAARRALRWQFRHDPPGYRKAVAYLQPAQFRAGENILKDRVLTGSLSPGPVPKWDFTPGLTKGFFGRRTKFWGVVDRSGRWRFPVI